MKTPLGKIVDAVTMTGMSSKSRMFVLNRDCSKDIQFGELVEVHIGSDIVTVKLIDGLLESGAKVGSDQAMVSAMRVEDEGFPENNKLLQGCEVFKV